VVTIFFGTFVAGSFLNQIQLFISAPKSILRILGAAAPQTASFFMSYLLLLGLTTKPILFLRIPRASPCLLYPISASLALTLVSVKRSYGYASESMLQCFARWSLQIPAR